MFQLTRLRGRLLASVLLLPLLSCSLNSRGAPTSSADKPPSFGKVASASVANVPVSPLAKSSAELNLEIASQEYTLQYRKGFLPDLSFMNQEHGPAGSHGRLLAKGAHLEFEDGTPAKFWGTNLTAYALFGATDLSRKFTARHLARLGFNIVRLHHHDSAWVKPNLFAEGPTTQHLSKPALESIALWIRELKAVGIYVWIDIEVGRRFKKGDNIPGFDELKNGDARGKSIVNPRIKKLSEEFAHNYITYKMKATGLSLANDPAVVAFLLRNESDLVYHFGNGLLRDKNVPYHNQIFEKKISQFATQNGLNPAQALRTWEPGVSKIALTHLEYQNDFSSIIELRKSAPSTLIAASNTWAGNPVGALAALSAGNLNDVHSYGKAGFLQKNPNTHANFIHWIGAAQVAGRPLAVTEWSVPPPHFDRFSAPTYVASIAALQGWDMVMHYAYQQYAPQSLNAHPDIWSSVDDPASMGGLPAAALLFRRSHVSRAKKQYHLALTEQETYFQNTSPKTSRTIRTMIEQSGLEIGLPNTPALPWDQFPVSTNVHVIHGTDVSYLKENTTEIVSDTGELKRDFKKGVQYIDTPFTQGASGNLGGEKIHLSDVDMHFISPGAAVYVSSLDERPISSSRRLLLSVVGPAKTKQKRLPYLSLRLIGELTINNPYLGCAQKIGPLGPVSSELQVNDSRVRLKSGSRGFPLWTILSEKRPGKRCE